MNDTVERVADATADYPFKVWGFGESIAMHALLAAKIAFAEERLRQWAAATLPVRTDPLAHVAPGVPLLELYARTREPVLLERASELGHALLDTPTGRHGARIHRPDLEGWQDEVWVDCMHLDGPFLSRLAQFDSSQPWLDMAVELLLGHARVLQDEPSGLFSHGFDDAAGRPNGVVWGRGQGWALLGLVDTLSVLPSGHACAAEIRHRLEALVERLRAYEVDAGRWHTVIDAPHTYLEASVSAFVALGIGDAVRLGLLPSRWHALANRALQATRNGLNARGELVGVSDATPVGPDVAHYAQRPTGVFPWGQGPALLALLHSVKMEVA